MYLSENNLSGFADWMQKRQKEICFVSAGGVITGCDTHRANREQAREK